MPACTACASVVSPVLPVAPKMAIFLTAMMRGRGAASRKTRGNHLAARPPSPSFSNERDGAGPLGRPRLTPPLGSKLRPRGGAKWDSPSARKNRVGGTGVSSPPPAAQPQRLQLRLGGVEVSSGLGRWTQRPASALYCPGRCGARAGHAHQPLLARDSWLATPGSGPLSQGLEASLGLTHTMPQGLKGRK